MKSFCIVSLAGLLLFFGESTKAADFSLAASNIAQRYNLHIEGNPISIPTTLPVALSQNGWPLIQKVCESVGYNLSPYAGQPVDLVKYKIRETYSVHPDAPDEPLYFRLVVKEEKILCGYLSFRESSNAAPGVFALNHYGLKWPN